MRVPQENGIKRKKQVAGPVAETSAGANRAALPGAPGAGAVLTLHPPRSRPAAQPVRLLDNGGKRAPLRQKDIFAGLTEEEHARVMSKCVVHQYKAGAFLCTQGNRHIETYIIQTGLVRSYYSSPMGREIALAYWSEGDLVGGPNFLDEDGIHLWSAQAAENCTVLAIKGMHFRNLAANIPALAEQVFDAICFKMRWFSLLVQMLGTESVSGRLAKLLIMLCDLHGVETEEGIAIKYCFSQEDLAQMVGATRQWVSVALGHLQKSGIVRVRKRQLIILNIDSLRSLGK